MKLKMKRIVALLIVAMLVFSTFGCGKGGNKDKTNASKHNGGKEVEIKYVHLGLGKEWLDGAIEAFNAKQSDWYVYYTATSDTSSAKAAFGQEDIDTIDLYIATVGNDTSDMEPLDDLLDSTADGDSKKLSEKFKTYFIEYGTDSDGHYYSLPNSELTVGIVYNKALFAKAGIEQAPRTTDELAIIGETLLDAGITPWIHFKSGGYYDSMRFVWQAQYDGVDYYYDTFRTLTDNYGNTSTKDVLTKQDGRYETIKVFEKILTPETVVAGSNSQDHITAQTMFLNQDVGMMVNGSWLSNEMEGTGNIDDFAMMKTPVISSITDKLTTVKREATLRRLVSAIDDVTSGKKDISAYQSGDGYVIDGETISAEDWDYVKAARNSLYSGIMDQGFFIPKYSDAKEGAKEFLKFFYSDEWKLKHLDYLHESFAIDMSNEEYDFEGWNAFEKSVYEVTATTEHAIVRAAGRNSHPIFKEYWTDDVGNYQYIPDLCSVNEADQKTADEIWELITKSLGDIYKQWFDQLN